MPKRDIPTNVENLLINNEPFEYAHLVKFERPFNPKDGEFRTGANRYVYLTDGARDISYDGNIYRAHRLQSVGNYSETTVARATNMSLILSGEDLGLSYTFKGSQTGATLSAATTGLYDGSEEVDFVEVGFREGDKVKIVRTNGQNYSNGDSHRIFIISSFSNNNQAITLAVTGTDTDDNPLTNITNQNLTMTLENEELSGATLDRGVNASNPLFTNREVFVHKIFFDAEGVEKGVVQVFKGIIANTSISEASTGSRVKWGLTSHWGDFVQVGGRLTLDEVHRSLDSNGKPSIDSAIKPSYATDLGFQHAETSLNTIANYKTTETRTVMKSKRRGGIGFITGERKYYEVEEQYEVDHQVDLNVHLKGRHLPVVYGVQRVPGIPVFADTKNNNSKEVYVAYALAEGKIQGLYNMYFEGSPIICTDKSDFEVRNAVNGTERAETQLQCYGRADRGDTLSGSGLTGSSSTIADDAEYEWYDEKEAEKVGDEKEKAYIGANWTYITVDEDNVSALTSTSNAKGLQTLETASITSPFNMHFTFHQGSSNQKANDNLVTIAQNNGFKIQNDYYTGSKPYWSPNHRLLDTAYTVMKFIIEADQTTIPEVEYVIRGKVLECHNYDGTFVPDAVLGASDAATNFKNGSTCNVEVSTDGSSWITIEDDATPFDDGGADKVFRVVHNYSYYNSDGAQETRIRLDSIPNLNYGTDGIATYPYVRLKSGSNNWHMLSHNAGTVSTAANFPNLFKTPTSMSTNSSGVLSATFSTADANALKNVHGTGQTVYNLGGTLTGTALVGYTNNVLFGTWNSNTITFRGSFTASETITGVTLSSAGAYDLSSNSNINSITNAAAIVGETLTIVETAEERTVTSFDTTNKYVVLDSPFTQVVSNNNTFTLNGRGKDLRATTNPAIQTLDYITNKRYGKDLNRYTELDLPSFKASALLCDTRSDVTLTLTGNQSCVKGDVYKLIDTQSNHVASGQVLANTSSSNTVTFTAVSGKFFRQYFNYVLYKIGDFVTHEDKVYEVTTAGYKTTPPTHSSGTTNGFKYLSSVTLTRESGTGPTSLALLANGTLPKYSLYDSDFIKYWRYLGWESHDQEWVTRHQTNFTLDTSKSIFANVNALLSHFNGILTYSNGKYELNVETQVDAPVETISNGIQSNPLHIKNEDIIGNISLVDNTQRTSKNTIKASLSDPQNNWGSRSISFFNSDFLKADRNVIKTGSFPFSGITNYYNGRINVEKELIQSRFSKEISFTVGQRGLLLKAGEVISISYSPFNFTNKRFRIENLTFNANCTVSVKAREYDDSIYAITPQRASIAHAAQTGANPSLEKPGAPTSLATTNNKPGVITVSWSNATDFSAASDYTEVFRHTADSRANATLLATISDAVTFNDVVADAGTFYYWVRHKRNSKLTNTNKTTILEGNYNASAGVSGVAKTLSAQLDIDVSSMQVKFDASGDLSPTGSAQDVLLTATLRNLTPNSSGVVFSIVNSDQTSQSQVKFTNGSTTLTDTSSPYQATVDASTVLNSTTNKFIKITTTDVSGEVFTELVPLTITRDGSSGSIGKDAAAVSLVADTNTIVYSANDADSEDPSNQSVTLTATGLGISGANSPFSSTPTYTFSINGGNEIAATSVTSGNVSATFNLPDSNEPAAEGTTTITVFLKDGSGGTLKASDSVTIFGVKSGSDSTTAFLTNSAHVVSTASDGSGASFTNAGGTFKVFIGSTPTTTGITFTEHGTSSGVTVNMNSGTGAYTVSAMSADIGTAVFRATISDSASPTGTGFTIDQTYTIAKSKAGTAGASGSDSKVVTLTADKSSVIYDSASSNPTPSGNITFTASTKNFTHPRFKFILDGTAGSFSSGNGNQRSSDNIFESDTQTFSIPSSYFATPKQFTVQVAENGSESTILAFDNLSIPALKQVADGDDGADAHTVFNTNSAHTFPAANNGTVANSDEPAGATTIQVYRGATQLTYAASGGGAGTNTYDVSVSTTGITLAASTVSNQRVFTPTAVTASTGSATFTITAGGLTFTSIYTFSKSIKGSDGSDGDSVYVARIYLQRAISIGATPPTPPSGGTYNFSNDTLSAPTGWTTTEPGFAYNQIIYKSEKVLVGSGTVSITFPQSVVHNPFFDNTKLIFKRSATTPAANANSLTSSFGIPSGFSETPPTGTDPLWQVTGTLLYTGVDAYKYDWSAAVKITGDTGGAGQSVKTVDLFKKNDSTFGTTTAGSFASPTNGVESGWTTTQPAITASADKVYKVTRTFTSDGNSPQDSSWSSPVIVAQREDGNNDPRSAFVTIFNPSNATSGVSLPTDTTAGTPYNFETAVLTIGSGGTSGWVTTRPSSSPYWLSQVRIKETTAYEGSQTVDYLLAERVGGAGRKDPGDWLINWDDTNNRLQLEIDSIVVSQPTYPTKLRNDEIIDGSGNIKDTVGLSLPSGGGTFSPTEFKNLRASFDNIGNSGTIQLQAGIVPIDDTNFFKVDSGEIKFGDDITYAGKITAGSSNNVAVLDGADSTYRIYAGHATAANAPFQVKQTGAVRANEVFIGSTSGTAMSVSTGTNRFQIRTPGSGVTGTVLEVGGESGVSTYVPLKVNNDGTGELRGFDIFTSGGTKLFDASTGFTDAAFTEIAEATGTSVASISKTSSGNADSDSQKITISSSQTITVKAAKNALFSGIGFNNSGNSTLALNTANSKVPTTVEVKVLYNTSNSRSGATQIGGTLSFTKYSSGTQSATQYRLDQQVETEPGFAFAEVELIRANHSNSSMSESFSASSGVGAGTASFASNGNFELEMTHTISAGDHYYWIEIDGAGSSGNGTVGDVTDDSAVRVLTLTAASGSTFNVSGGDGSETSDDVNNATITTAAGNGLTGGGNFTTNQGTAETITFNVVGGDGITANTNEIEVAVDNTTIELSATSGSGTVRAKTATIANGGTALATADQIHTFVTSQGYVTSSGNTIIGTDTDLNTSGAEVVDQINVTDGVIQSMSKRTLTLANLGYTGATNANNYVLPTNLAGDDINIDTGALTGATVISDLDFNITTNTSGLVTDANASVATRTLTLANLGYTGATNADVTPSWVPSSNPNYLTSIAANSIGAAELNVSGNGTAGYVLKSDGDGSFTWTANAISSYTNSGDNRVITSTGSTGINAEYALNYDRVNGLKVHNHNGTGGLTSVATLTLGKSPFNSGISNLILDSKSQGSIKFQDGSTTDASITYDGVISNKLSITSGTITLSGTVETTSTLSTGRVTTSGTGIANIPTLDIINSSSNTFNHSIEAMTPNLTAGESNILVFGRAGSTKNSGYIGYKYSSAGSNNNVITIGHWGSNHLVTINGVGNTIFAGTINSGAITSSGAVSATEYDLPSNGMLDWANGDARIVEGLVNNYSLSFQTYDGSACNTALRLDGNNAATFTGTISNSAFTIPNSIGSAGEVLKVPSSGTTLEWGTVSGGSGLPSGMAYSSSILDVTGAIRATGDVTAFHSSDERLKDNITVIDSALAKVKQLRGVEFDWNDKQDLHKGHDIGVIAQDVEQVAPELVRDREDGYKAVDYPKLTALLIEAVKELELKVKELEDKQK